MKEFLALLVSAIMTLSGCTAAEDEAVVPTESIEESIDDAAVLQLLSQMTLDEKIYQMMFVTAESITGAKSVTAAGEATRTALEKYPVGGIIYFGSNIVSPEQVTQMITNTQSYSKIPLFIGVDEEGGRVARLGNKKAMGTTKLPTMKNVKSAQEAYAIGQTLGQDLKKYMFNVDFAPVADVIVYEKNSEIGDRSFGSDPYQVGDMVQWVVKGLEENGVSSVLKHFPGHGSTKTNSHTGKSESTRTLDELRGCEFIPFKMGIDAGCDFVMVSHMTLTNATEEKLPSSLSYEVITQMLKGELGFDGICITDSLSMGAITTVYDGATAAVMAVKAGADMLLMSPDVLTAKDAIKAAVENGEITEDKIDESVYKILMIKQKKGILQ